MSELTQSEAKRVRDIKARMKVINTDAQSEHVTDDNLGHMMADIPFLLSLVARTWKSPHVESMSSDEREDSLDYIVQEVSDLAEDYVIGKEPLEKCYADLAACLIKGINETAEANELPKIASPLPVPVDDEMVERHAIALHEFDLEKIGRRGRPGWDKELPEYRDHIRAKSRFALEAALTQVGK